MELVGGGVDLVGGRGVVGGGGIVGGKDLVGGVVPVVMYGCLSVVGDLIGDGLEGFDPS